MDGKSCARLLVIAGFTRIHAATDKRRSPIYVGVKHTDPGIKPHSKQGYRHLRL